MAIIGFNESSLVTSEIYRGMNDISEMNVKDRAIHLIKTAKHLSQSDIELSYISVKNITDSLTRASVKAFETGRIVLLYNETPSLSMTQAMPFITFKKGDEFITYIFMDKYITKSKDGVINIQANILRDLLQSALIANSLKLNYNRLVASQYLQKTLMGLYTKFVIRIINREFSIGSDKIIGDTIQYWINRFFLYRILGATDNMENLEKLASSGFRYIDEIKYEDIKRQYDDADPIEISNLLDLVKTANPRMRTLGLGMFMSNWINYYYIPSMLAIDNIEYLIFMILALLSGNNIISISAGEMVRDDKNIKGLKEELFKLI